MVLATVLGRGAVRASRAGLGSSSMRCQTARLAALILIRLISEITTSVRPKKIIDSRLTIGSCLKALKLSEATQLSRAVILLTFTPFEFQT